MQETQPTIGHYQIISELGIGGMAVVYRALDTQANREVALKILLPQFVEDQTFLQRFLREGQNTKRLRHPHIVRTFDAGVVDQNYYIAMELIEGPNLAEYIQQKAELLEFKESIDILSQVASALDYAHSLGFLHRDIKLTNILMSNDGRALLSDFGAAKHISTDYTMLTTAGQSIGTPSYMSPEQARAEVNLDFRTDVYSLGVLAFKLFTGRMPYVADSQPELLYKIVYDDIPEPKAYNDAISEMLSNVLKRVLAKNPQARYESAGAFVSAIVASKRWRLNIAEDLTKSSDLVQDPETTKKSVWRGLSLAVSALATVVIVLALSTAVRTQDYGELGTPNISNEMMDEAVTDMIGDVSNNFPSLDLSSVVIPTTTFSSLPVEIPGVGEGQINVRDLGVSSEQLSEYWEKVPGSATIHEFGRSVMALLPGAEVDLGSESTFKAYQDDGAATNPASVTIDTKDREEATNKPPLYPIQPRLPAP